MSESVNFNKPTRKPLLLLSPLDWGLGHTTRCIPIIKELANLGCNIVIACNSIQKKIFHAEFTDTVQYVELEGYGIRYGKNRLATFGRLFLQAPKILTHIKREHKWLQAYLASNRVDGIISDNRFGLFSPSIPSIFITHQLQVKTGFGAWADRIVLHWNYSHIHHFSKCWVPDHEDAAHSLAGELSHPATMPRTPVQYLGNLSRMEPCQARGGQHLLILLSGPEPLRSIFEQALLRQANDHPGPIVIVRGLPAAGQLPEAPAHCKLYNHVDAATLQNLVCRASYVISRCGYTTVMDLLKLGTKSILIPTPGQAEQEYLAIHLKEQQWAYTISQADFRLKEALQAASQFNYRTTSIEMQQYKPVLAAWVDQLRKQPSKG